MGMYQKIRTQGSLIKTEEENVYRVREVIAESNGSRILKAEEGDSGETVLLKEYLPDSSSELNGDSLVREAAKRELHLCMVIKEAGFPGALILNQCVQEQESGIIFGVMREVRKGRTLQKFVRSEEWKQMVLQDRLQLAYDLFKLINNLHKETGIIHGDLSPSNIYLYDTGMESERERTYPMALLDFGCSVCSGENQAAQFIGGTEGYVHPQLWEGIRDKLQESDDWYAAVQIFWYLLTGRSPIEYPITEDHLEEICEEKAVKYEINYLTHCGQENIMEIPGAEDYHVIFKELEELFLLQTEYDSGIILTVRKLLDLIKKTGISREYLCTLLKTSYTEMAHQRFANQDIIRRILPQVGLELKKGRAKFTDSDSAKPMLLKDFMENSFNSQNSLLMIGDGGVGKTTSLIDIMNQFYGGDNADFNRPLVFMELCVLSQNHKDWYSEEEKGTFIEQFIASYFLGKPGRFADKNHPYVRAVREDLFRHPERGGKAYTILLDGLNEVGFADTISRVHFVDSLNHYLLYAKNMRLIIAGRNDIHELSSDHLKRLKTVGLDDTNISEMLQEAVTGGRLSQAEFNRLIQKKEDVSSKEYRLWNCLRIPFFLIMYCFVSERQGLTRQGEILSRFFHDKRETLDHTVVYGEKLQSQAKYKSKSYDPDLKLRMDLSIRVLLDFIIPEIGIEMVSTNHFYISWDRLTVFLESTLKRFREETHVRWTRTFYGYHIDVRDIFAKIYEIDRGLRIADYACDVLGIMRMTADQALFFTHQYFRDYFAACAIKNRMLQALEYEEEEGILPDRDKFCAAVKPFQEKELPPYLCSFVGEMLGEHHNMPFFDLSDRKWKIPDVREEEQEIIGRFLDLYRFPWVKGIDPTGKAFHTGLRNTIEILKHSRIQNTGETDFAGLSLDGLYLQGISLYGINFSHYNPSENQWLCATFSEAKYARQALEETKDQGKFICCSIHPSERKLLLVNEITGMLAELNLDTGEQSVLGEGIRDLVYAEYTGESGDIFLIVSEKRGRKKKRRLPGKKETFLFPFRGRANNREEEIQEKTTLYCFRRSQEKILRLFPVYGQFLKAARTDLPGRFALCIKNDLSGTVKLFLVNLDERHMEKTSKKEDDPEKIFLEGTCVLPDQESFLDSSSETFWFSYAGEGQFLIGDVEQRPGCVGLWDIAAGKLSTALHMQDPDENRRIEAVACDRKNGTVYVIVRNDTDGDKTERNRYGSLAQYKPDDTNQWENALIQSGKLKELGLSADSQIQMLPGEDALIALYDHQCMKVDGETKQTLWTLPCAVHSFHLKNGIMIANGEDGIFEIDTASGSFSCIHRYKKKLDTFIIGRTNLPGMIISFNGKQIVKWIDAGTGTVSRHIILQETGKKYGKLFGDGKQEKILGISGKTVTCWDGGSGLVIDSWIIPIPQQYKLTHIDFDDTGDWLLIYYIGMDYSVFPLQKYMALETWNRNEELPVEVEKRHIQKMERQFHFIVSGKYRIIEEAEKPTYPVRRKPHKRRKNEPQTIWDRLEKSITDLLVIPEESDDIDDWFDDDRNVIWNQDMVFSQCEFKSLYLQKENKKPFFVDVIDAEDKVIGCTGGIIVSSYEGDYNSQVLKLYHRNYDEGVEMKLLQGRYVENAFMTGETAVFHQKTKSWGPGSVLFWDLRGEDVYEYKPEDHLLCTGCVIDAPKDRQAEPGWLWKLGKDKGEKARNVVGQVRKTQLSDGSQLKPLKERWKKVNLPSLLVVLALTVLSCFFYDAVEAGVDTYVREVMEYRMARFFVSGIFLAFLTAAFLPRATNSLESRKWDEAMYLALAAVFALFPVGWKHYGQEMLINFDFQYFNTYMWFVFPLYIVMLKRDRNHGLLSVLYMAAVILLGYQLFDCHRMSETILFTYILFTAVTWFYMTSMKLQRFDLKKAGAFLLNALGIAACLAGMFLYILKRAENSGIFLLRLEDYRVRWEPYIQRSREVLRHMRLMGAGYVPEIAEENWEYFSYYQINFIFGRYGILAGIGVIGLFVLLFYLLFKGARHQRVPVDRHICYGCSFFLTIQFIIYLLPNLGLQLIPPYSAPFLQVGFPYFNSSWMALLVYQTYFRAHRIR